MRWVLLTVFIIKMTELGIENLRLLLFVNGHPMVASILATLDVGLSLLALKYIVENLTQWKVYVAYALGYGAGTYVGSVLYSSLCGG